MTLVVGASNELGGVFARRLLEQGCGVKILVRPGSDYLALVQAGARPVVGDLGDPLSVRSAVRDVDTVIIAAAAQDGEDEANVQARRPDDYLSLIDEAASAGVRRFIYTAAPDAGQNSLPPADWKVRVEQHLRAGGRSCTSWIST